MWAVATSAALFDQIVQAPRPICARIMASQTTDQNLAARATSSCLPETSGTATAIEQGRQAMGHLNPNLQALVFISPAAIRSALILSIATALVSGIQLP